MTPSFTYGYLCGQWCRLDAEIVVVDGSPQVVCDECRQGDYDGDC